MREWLIHLPKPAKRAIVVACDLALLTAALALAFVFRLDRLPLPQSSSEWLTVALAPTLAIVGLRFAGVYRLVVRDMGGDGLRRILLGLGGGAIAWGAICFTFSLAFVSVVFVPRSVFFGFLILGFVLLAGIRTLAYLYFTDRQIDWQSLLTLEVAPQRRKTALIVGYELSTPKIARQLALQGRYRIAGIIHDDPTMEHRKVDGYKIYGTGEIDRILSRGDVDDVFLLASKFTAPRRLELFQEIGAHDVEVKQLPTFSDIESGRVNVSDLRPVDVMQLLGREPVPPLEDLLDGAVRDRAVLITGAGGSIGSELARMTAGLGPRKLVLVETSETALYAIQQELAALGEAVEAGLREARTGRDGTAYETDLSRARGQFPEVVGVLASVVQPGELDAVFEAHEIDVVYHAAAYKHVPIVEGNMAAGVRNNSFGTLRLAQASCRAGVGQFIMISTDKAVRPTNIMGASKRLAEMFLKAIARDPATQTRFAMVRFGNVLGSSGSVVPLFHRQIAAGGPITVTHPEITRYFMSIPEAVQLVIQSGAMSEQGALYVLDMGEPVRIVELARAMINLAGLTERSDAHPDGDIEIAFVGLRPGEKLYEELLIDGASTATRHPRIRRQEEPATPMERLTPLVAELEAAVAVGGTDDEVKRLMRRLVADYRPAETEDEKGLVIPFRRAAPSA
ncbi:MAG: nucleoside-diphosphate sugar epimerase/dehydratase [Pseudomonadota bacterium]